MKKLILLFIVSLSFLHCSDNLGLVNLHSHKSNIGDEYLQTNVLLDYVDYLIFWVEFPGTDPSICFMGDSRVQWFPLRHFWPDRHMWNIGLLGTTLYGVEIRVDTVKKFKPDIIYISVGVNDIMRDATTNWIPRYSAALDELLTFCPRIYVTSVVPVAGFSTLDSIVNPSVPPMNEELSTLCSEKGVTFIDLSVLEDGNGKLRSDLTIDGLHFNLKAYTLIYNILKSYF
jgi:hexosaminidase